jgi:hypothetical protein
MCQQDQVQRHIDADKDLGDAGLRANRAAEAAGRAPHRPVPAADAVQALMADRSRAQALRARWPAAPHARYECRPAGVPVTHRRCGLGLI